MRRLILLALISTLASAPVCAQQQLACGIHPASALGQRPGHVLLDRTQATAPETTGVRGGSRWAARGAAIGAVVVGAYGVGMQGHRSGDPLLRQPVVRFGAFGAVSGGLIGALAHAATHRAPRAVSPNVR
jgi:hypothetical protein